MATHGFSFDTDTESLYQRYLTLTGVTDAQVMEKLKNTLKSQVLQSIKELGNNKFNNSTIAEQLAYLES